MGHTSVLMFVLLACAHTAAIPTNPVIGINAGCTTSSIEQFCKPEHMFCIRSACSQCILRDPFNPFSSFCHRLTECVCNISNDERCVEKIANNCF